jgi:hypothetical protein
MSIRELQAAATAALNAAELAQQRFTAAALKVYATGAHRNLPIASEAIEQIRKDFDAAAKAHLEAQDQARTALAAADLARTLARQRRGVRQVRR